MTTENQAPEGGPGERKLAESSYANTAFNYPEAPIGSRDWCLYWDGWQARAALATQPQAAPAGLSEAHRQELIMLRSRVRTQRDELAKLKKGSPAPAEGDVAERLDRLLWEVIDFAAKHPAEARGVDPRTWQHLLVYQPQPKGTTVGEIVEMDDGALVPVWADGTPAAGTKLYAAPTQSPAPAYDDAKDAARYRWLREQCNDKDSKGTRIASRQYGMHWDAAIDAAMAAEVNVPVQHKEQP